MEGVSADVIERTTPASDRESIPAHLAGTPWPEFEARTALALFGALEGELKKLTNRATAKRVHDTRVTLRRWFSMWSVLKEDGWETKKFKRRVTKKLKRLLEVLGELRDWDVNLELGKSLGVSKALLNQWALQRADVRRRAKLHVSALKVDKLVERISEHLQRGLVVCEEDPRDLTESAYAHLVPFLIARENQARELEAAAVSPDELHQLRLGIKRWRYLLTEFFGLTNLQLVKAQQVLGKIHDLDRIALLMGDRPNNKATRKIEEQRGQLLTDLSRLRKNLPYGLRPAHISIESRE